MDTAYISALSALGGATIGGLASFTQTGAGSQLSRDTPPSEFAAEIRERGTLLLGKR